VKMIPDAPLPLGEADEYPALSFYNPNEIIQVTAWDARRWIRATH